MKEIQEFIENRLKDLNVNKENSSSHNGQIWARKDELNNILNLIKKKSK